MTILRALIAGAFCCLLGCGCGSADEEPTAEQIERQRAEDKLNSAVEDKAEAEFQKKVRQQGS